MTTEKPDVTKILNATLTITAQADESKKFLAQFASSPLFPENVRHELMLASHALDTQSTVLRLLVENQLRTDEHIEKFVENVKKTLNKD